MTYDHTLTFCGNRTSVSIRNAITNYNCSREARWDFRTLGKKSIKFIVNAIGLHNHHVGRALYTSNKFRTTNYDAINSKTKKKTNDQNKTVRVDGWHWTRCFYLAVSTATKQFPFKPVGGITIICDCH